MKLTKVQHARLGSSVNNIINEGWLLNIRKEKTGTVVVEDSTTGDSVTLQPCPESATNVPDGPSHTDLHLYIPNERLHMVLSDLIEGDDKLNVRAVKDNLHLCKTSGKNKTSTMKLTFEAGTVATPSREDTISEIITLIRPYVPSTANVNIVLTDKIHTRFTTQSSNESHDIVMSLQHEYNYVSESRNDDTLYIFMSRKSAMVSTELEVSSVSYTTKEPTGLIAIEISKNRKATMYLDAFKQEVKAILPVGAGVSVIEGNGFIIGAEVINPHDFLLAEQIAKLLEIYVTEVITSDTNYGFNVVLRLNNGNEIAVLVEDTAGYITDWATNVLGLAMAAPLIPVGPTTVTGVLDSSISLPREMQALAASMDIVIYDTYRIGDAKYVTVSYLDVMYLLDLAPKEILRDTLPCSDVLTRADIEHESMSCGSYGKLGDEDFVLLPGYHLPETDQVTELPHTFYDMMLDVSNVLLTLTEELGDVEIIAVRYVNKSYCVCLNIEGTSYSLYSSYVYNLDRTSCKNLVAITGRTQVEDDRDLHSLSR